MGERKQAVNGNSTVNAEPLRFRDEMSPDLNFRWGEEGRLAVRRPSSSTRALA